jgi:hypothetical protein
VGYGVVGLVGEVGVGVKSEGSDAE